MTAKSALTLEEQADRADSELLFEKRYAEAMGDQWRDAIREKTRALYTEDPSCGVCAEHITDIHTASLWEPAGSKPFLVCGRGECHVKALTTSMERYVGRSRRTIAYETTPTQTTNKAAAIPAAANGRL